MSYTLVCILLHYGLIIVRPSSLKVKNMVTHVGFGLCIQRDFLLFYSLVSQSLPSFVCSKVLWMSSVFLNCCKVYRVVKT